MSVKQSSDLPSRLLVLAGPPCSGKSSVSNALGAVYNLRVTDLDTLIEKKVGKSITEIFRVDGEECFRALETEVLEKLLASGVANYDVVSLGGGTLLAQRNRELVADNATLVMLRAQDKTVLSRVIADEEKSDSGSIRPLFKQADESSVGADVIGERVFTLLEKRREVYRLGDLSIWTDWASAESVAKIIADFRAEKLQAEPMVVMPYRLGESQDELEVVIGKDNLRQFVKDLSGFGYMSVGILIDENVDRIHGKKIRKDFELMADRASFVSVPSGENSKSLSYIEKVCDEFVGLGLTRNSAIIGIGGGVVGDTAGLVASLFMRGIDLYHIPSTIVAQVDSAIGGKTGVNLRVGKNLVGTFLPAKSIVSDVELLLSLEEREFVSGMAEVIKYGLIADSDYFFWILRNLKKIKQRDLVVLRQMVEGSSSIKLSHVVEDFRDRLGRRAFLNFGHTLGHGLEKLSGYGELLHGEAISIGMVFAASYGEDLGITEKGVVDSIRSAFSEFGLPVDIPEEMLQGRETWVEELNTGNLSVGLENWRAVLAADKKRDSLQLQYVLLERVGQAVNKGVCVENVLAFLAKY